MTSNKQVVANRSNCQLSSGPKSGGGKRVVSQNARKHGLLSQHLYVPEDQKSYFNEMRNAYILHLAPKNELEFFIVERIISCIWRLHLLTLVEKQKYEEGLEFSYGNRNLNVSFVGKSADNMIVLSRYEKSIENSLYRALKELKMLQYQSLNGCGLLVN